MSEGSLPQLAARLGISDRYLRRLFARTIGVTPKTYGLYPQCSLAKQLLHQTSLSIAEIALASGFRSIRRFNECFQQHLALTPTPVRRGQQKAELPLGLFLAYRPLYNWPQVRDFFQRRAVPKWNG